MPVSKEKEKFIREAGSAIVAILGVNDTTSLVDIHKIRSIIESANEAYFFTHNISADPSIAEMWGREFAKKYPALKDEVHGAIWDLYILQKFAKKLEDALKFAVNSYTEDPAKEFN